MRTERKENVRRTFLANGPGGAVARLSYTQDKDGELQIIEENHYYPYGLKHQNYNVDKLDFVEGENGYVLASESALQYKYKFNGMEWQEDLGLNTTAMDFRQYDNAIGRFTSIDALADFFTSLNPNQFSYNNPVYFHDPTGLYPEGPGSEKGQGHSDADGDGEWDGAVWVGLNGTINYLEPVLVEDNTGGGGGVANSFTVVEIYMTSLHWTSSINSTMVYTYGTSTISATELTAQNTIRMNQIMKGAKIGGYLVSVAQIGYGVYHDGGEFGDNAQIATGGAVVGIAGAWAGAKLFGSIGFVVAGPAGALVGALVGSIVGSYIGSEAGSAMVKSAK